MSKRFTQLTEPGTSEEILVKQYKTSVLDVTVSSIDTSINVAVESSFDKIVWVNVDKDEVTIDSDGVCRFILTQDLPVEYLRLNWISETGGTNAVVDIVYIGLL